MMELINAAASPCCEGGKELVMNIVVTLKVMSIPRVAQVIDVNIHAQKLAPSGARANKSGAPTQHMPENKTSVVPETRWRMKPPKIPIKHPPIASGVNHATSCRLVAPIISVQ